MMQRQVQCEVTEKLRGSTSHCTWSLRVQGQTGLDELRAACEGRWELTTYEQRPVHNRDCLLSHRECLVHVNEPEYRGLVSRTGGFPGKSREESNLPRKYINVCARARIANLHPVCGYSACHHMYGVLEPHIKLALFTAIDVGVT